jgi:hypothetical protein
MSALPLLSAAGRRRSPVTLPGYLAERPPRHAANRACSARSGLSEFATVILLSSSRCMLTPARRLRRLLV